MTPEQLAKEFNLDVTAVKSFLSYMQNNLTKSPELMTAFINDPDKIIKDGIAAWLNASQKFFNELLENKTERAQLLRSKMAEEVYTEIRMR